MKRLLLLVAVLVFAVVTIAVAVPAGKTLTYDKSSEGKVEFSGKVHSAAGVSCKECHNKEMFPKMKQGSVEITMDRIYAGELCGVCHNGTRAFEAKTSCNRCHVK